MYVCMHVCARMYVCVCMCVWTYSKIFVCNIISIHLLSQYQMSKMLDDVNMKISEQNITALLLLLEEEDFDNSLLECYNKASKLWDN